MDELNRHLDNLNGQFDRFYQERAEAIERIKMHKLEKLLSEYDHILPLGVETRILNLLATPNRQTTSDLSNYLEELGYYFEFQQPEHENLETTPTEAGRYIMQLNLNPDDYRLVLKKVVAEV